MAKKRIISREVVESDSFCKMSESARLLYFYFVLGADDDGILNSAGRTASALGLSEGELDELCHSGFVLPLCRDVYLIAHWKVHNTKSFSWYRPSAYAHLLSGFRLDGLGAYVRRTPEEKDAPNPATDTPHCEEKKKEAASDGAAGGGAAHDGAADAMLELNVARYFLDREYLSSPDGFIAYNASRGWRGVGGEDVKENYERYSDEWEKSYRIKHGLPLPTNSI